MHHSNKTYLQKVVAFIIIYGAYVFITDMTTEHYSEIILASTFFFTLFAVFFIERQNHRFSQIASLLSKQDGGFSYMYRVTGSNKTAQEDVRNVIKDHYTKVLDTGDWAYHLKNPSTSISDLTAILNREIEKELKSKKHGVLSESQAFVWEALYYMQTTRKELMKQMHERLLPYQWALVYVMGILLVVSFDFIPTDDLFIINFLKIIFGLAVFLVITLLHKIDDLALFGKDFATSTVTDIFRIIEERDREEVEAKKEEKEKNQKPKTKK